MTVFTYIVLAFGALLGSTVSGVTGVGGGMVYLPFLTWGVGIKQAVPYLSLLLIVSNVSRAWFARGAIDWKVVKAFAVGAVPGTLAGALLYTWFSAALIAKILGVYLLAYVALTFTKSTWPKTATLRSISVIGVPAGIVSAVVGGSGPVVVPWFLRYGLTKEAFLGTEATCAALMHLIKIAVWGGAGIIRPYDVLLLLPLGLLMIAGSFFGMVLVSRMRVKVFRAILMVTLVAVGVRFLLY